MDLNLLAEEMKATARQNPHNQDRAFLVPEVCCRTIELDGIRINVVLSYNEWDSIPEKAWQVSISREDMNGKVPDEQIIKLVTALLGTKDIFEITDQMPKEFELISQFILKD